MRTKLQESQFHLFAMTGFFKGVATRIRQFQDNPLTSEPLKSNLFLVLDRVNLVNIGIEVEWKRRKLPTKGPQSKARQKVADKWKIIIDDNQKGA